MSCGEQILLIVQCITTVIILLTLLVYYFQLRTMRSVMIHQVLRDILMEYRSAEMLVAIRTLWTFYREHSQDLIQAYEETRKREEKSIENLPASQRLESERSTLHYLRRLLSQYYAFLSGLYELKIIPENILYTYWSEGDLRIIPKILIPIERQLAETFGTLAEEDPGLARLQKLYDDCPKRLKAEAT